MSFAKLHLDALAVYWRTHPGTAPDEPSCMYLGHEEWTMLKQERVSLLFAKDATALNQRLTYRGAQVFCVDAQSHLAFSP